MLLSRAGTTYGLYAVAFALPVALMGLFGLLRTPWHPTSADKSGATQALHGYVNGVGPHSATNESAAGKFRNMSTQKQIRYSNVRVVDDGGAGSFKQRGVRQTREGRVGRRCRTCR